MSDAKCAYLASRTYAIYCLRLITMCRNYAAARQKRLAQYTITGFIKTWHFFCWVLRAHAQFRNRVHNLCDGYFIRQLLRDHSNILSTEVPSVPPNMSQLLFLTKVCMYIRYLYQRVFLKCSCLFWFICFIKYKKWDIFYWPFGT